MLTPNQIPIVTVPAEPSSMLVILLKIRNQTAEAIFPATLLGKFTHYRGSCCPSVWITLLNEVERQSQI